MPVAVITTKHKKARIIQPILERIGFTVWEYSAFDTDALGMFSGEVERTLSPAECATIKAQKACELAGVRYGLGSEGSFGGGPYPGFMNWNEEILCLFDADTQQSILALAEGPFDVPSLEKVPGDILPVVKQYAGQHWQIETNTGLQKGLSAEQLQCELADMDQNTVVKVSPDLRAMHSPERQSMIANAAEDLLRRWRSPCPQCGAPDFVVKKVEAGLPCDTCGTPTRQIARRISECGVCHFAEAAESSGETADPAACPICNP